MIKIQHIQSSVCPNAPFQSLS